MLTLFYDPIYTDGLDPTVRFPRDRYQLLYKRLTKHSNIRILKPPLGTRDQLVTAHCPSYVDQFLNQSLPPDAIRRIGLRPWNSAIVERTLRIVGGAISATNHVLNNGGISGNMAGGTHHAYYNFGSGYCIFNDLAICAKLALQQPHIKRLLILDLDVHQGDGTAAILANEPQVFTCSIHAESNFPFRKQQSDLDVHLDDQIQDTDYLACLDRTLDKIRPEQYDCIFFQSGVDTLARDGLGHLALSREGLRKRNQRIIELQKIYKLPIVIFMGGGYAKPIEATVDAFEDLFVGAAKSLDQASPS